MLKTFQPPTQQFISRSIHIYICDVRSVSHPRIFKHTPLTISIHTYTHIFMCTVDILLPLIDLCFQRIAFKCRHNMCHLCSFETIDYINNRPYTPIECENTNIGYDSRLPASIKIPAMRKFSLGGGSIAVQLQRHIVLSKQWISSRTKGGASMGTLNDSFSIFEKLKILKAKYINIDRSTDHWRMDGYEKTKTQELNKRRTNE